MGWGGVGVISAAAQTQIWMFYCDFVKGLIDMGEFQPQVSLIQSYNNSDYHWSTGIKVYSSDYSS